MQVTALEMPPAGHMVRGNFNLNLNHGRRGVINLETIATGRKMPKSACIMQVLKLVTVLLQFTISVRLLAHTAGATNEA